MTPAARLGVAVSGGGDSLAVLALARDWVAASGAALLAATVDHGLRAESRAEAEHVAKACAAWAIPHEILTLGALSGPGNLSAKARNARYDALSGWAEHHDLSAVLLGHTMDDQAETILMRLARGSGAEGLSGMASEMHWDGVRYLRPVLTQRRDTLRTWLHTRGIAWIDDPTNQDDGYDRVKARQALEVLAPLGIDVPGLSATADRLARQRRVLEGAAADLIVTACRFDGDTATLDRATLRTALDDTVMRVLAGMLQKVGGNPYRPRFRALEPLYRQIVSDAQTTVTLAHCLVRLQPETITIVPEHPILSTDMDKSD